MAAEKVTEIPKTLQDAQSFHYLTGKQLGAGGFATCWAANMYSASDPSKPQQCALKAVKSKVPKNLVQRFRLELAIQSKLRHPHVVELHRAFTSDEVTYVALELCSNGSLTDMMRKRKYLTMGEIRRILIQLCGAVKYLHERDVVHRDIKAGNIFLDENMDIKLGDFGLAAIMEPSREQSDADPTVARTLQYIRRTTFCGTPNYLAPEILSRSKGHGTSVDIWSIGILAYYLSVGRAPFHSKSKDEIYERLRKGEYSWPPLAPDQNEIPKDLKSLVGDLLVEERRRPKPDDIVAHSFFKSGFLPERLEPLCLTRRPKWARTGSSAERLAMSQIYENLCRSSNVGHFATADIENSHQSATTSQSDGTSVTQIRAPRSMFIVLAKEMSRKVKLEIPLQEGIVYTGGSQASRSTSSQKEAETKVARQKSTTSSTTEVALVAPPAAHPIAKQPVPAQDTHQKFTKSSVTETAAMASLPSQHTAKQPMPAQGPPQHCVIPESPNTAEHARAVEARRAERRKLQAAKVKRPPTVSYTRTKPGAAIDVLEDVENHVFKQRTTSSSALISAPCAQPPASTIQSPKAARRVTSVSVQAPQSREKPTSIEPPAPALQAPRAVPRIRQASTEAAQPQAARRVPSVSIPAPQAQVEPPSPQAKTVERKLSERPKRLLRSRPAPAEPTAIQSNTGREPPTTRTLREPRQALQVNDRSNRVRKRVAAIEGKQIGAADVVEI